VNIFLPNLKYSSFFNNISQIRKKITRYLSKNKIHDYSKYIKGIDYSFESLKNGKKWYLTSQGIVSKGEIIILSEKEKLCQYKIKEVQYYRDIDNTFIALLTQA
jgi:hypothetical protein